MNDLDELAELTMRKVACDAIHENIPGQTTHCTICGDTKEILDPGLANLRKVLWVECPDCGGAGRIYVPHPYVPQEHHNSWGCGGCGGSGVNVAEEAKDYKKGTGYVRRTWDGPGWWPEVLVFQTALRDQLFGWDVGVQPTEGHIAATLLAVKAKV